MTPHQADTSATNRTGPTPKSRRDAGGAATPPPTRAVGSSARTVRGGDATRAATSWSGPWRESSPSRPGDTRRSEASRPSLRSGGHTIAHVEHGPPSQSRR